MKTLICQIDIEVDISLQSQRNKILRALNLHHYGSELIPLEVQREEIPQELRDATSQVLMVHRRKLKVQVYSDGSIALCLPQDVKE